MQSLTLRRTRWLIALTPLALAACSSQPQTNPAMATADTALATANQDKTEADQAMKTAQQALTTAQQAEATAKTASAESNKMYQRELRK